jgi:peptidoglycan/LPS O-acetylase OafA/YrhL
MAATAPAGGRPVDTEAPSPAVAPPPGNPRFPLFDSLRGIAVLAVLVFHVFLVTGALDRRVTGDAVTVLGSHGPIVFFAISGFLLYRPWVAARAAGAPALRASRYARRRALRILPAYWVALTALAIFPGVSGAFGDDWWRYYLFLQLYADDTLGRGIPVAWTLCVEMSFYLALPAWALALRRVPVASGRRSWLRTELVALALVAAAGAAVQLAGARQGVGDLAAQSLLGQCTWFALGMALAVASVGGGGRPPRSGVMRTVIERPGLCWAAAAAAFAGLVILRYDTGGLFGIIEALRTKQPIGRALGEIALTAVMITLLLVPAIFGERGSGLPRRILAAAPLAWLGVISYGVYLWHLTIAELLALPSMPQHFEASGLGLAAKIPQGATPIVLALTIAASCAVAAASYRFVELPFLRRKEG